MTMRPAERHVRFQTILALALAGDASWQVAGRTVGGLLGGGAMGGVNDAMILGHFYLMIKGLPLDALARTGRWCVGAVIARAVGFGVVLLTWPGAADVLLGREV